MTATVNLAELPAAAAEPAEVKLSTAAELLDQDEMLAILRAQLGEGLPEERLQAAAVALQEAATARWEALPPDIHPDMGYNFFRVCQETCWLGREALVFGSELRIFRRRGTGGDAG